MAQKLNKKLRGFFTIDVVSLISSELLKKIMRKIDVLWEKFKYYFDNHNNYIVIQRLKQQLNICLMEINFNIQTQMMHLLALQCQRERETSSVILLDKFKTNFKIN